MKQFSQVQRKFECWKETSFNLNPLVILVRSGIKSYLLDSKPSRGLSSRSKSVLESQNQACTLNCNLELNVIAKLKRPHVHSDKLLEQYCWLTTLALEGSTSPHLRDTLRLSHAQDYA